MKAERKRQAITDTVQEARDALRGLLIEQPRAWLGQARERLQNLPKTNFDLGVAFAEAGKWYDALFRFKVAAYFQPDYPQVYYNIGYCYFRMGKLPQAEVALKKALQQNPQQDETIFMLAALNPRALSASQLPQRMPAAMVRNFFSSVAGTYDIDEARNRYQAGKVMYDLAQPHVMGTSPVVLDLACGTGIAARPWRASAKEIIGVDGTRAMIEMAQHATHAEKKLFDELIEGDVAAPLVSLPPESVDVAMLVNSAHFVGELSGVMQSAARVLKAGGVLVLTVEPYTGSAGFGVSADTGRFGHSGAYVKQAASAVGLKLVKEATVQLYPEQPVQAFVFGKGSN